MAYAFDNKTDLVDQVMAAHINALQDALEAHEFLTLKAATELTISSGAITITQAVHKLQPESGTADDLTDINGMDAGDVLVLLVSDAGTDTITVKHGTGNISCIGGSDIALSEGAIIVYCDGTTYYVSGGGGSADGWNRVTDTWTYASATTITVPSGAASIYSIGDKIRLKQGGEYKYFYVIGVADTLLTVTGGSDFTVANADITDVYYSKVSSPVGFPNKFNFTPTLTNMAGGTINVAKFMLIGRRVSLTFRYTCAGADISGAVSASLPITAADMNYLNIIGSITYRDSDPASNYYGIVLASSTAMIFNLTKADATYATWTNISSTVPFTWAASDLIMVEASYFI